MGGSSRGRRFVRTSAAATSAPVVDAATTTPGARSRPGPARPRRRTGTLLVVTVALGLVAAACSGGEPVGHVGTTLSANDTDITLTGVYDPATVSPSSIEQPPFGRTFVATVLNLRNLSGSPVDLATIYRMSKLRDSKRRDHPPSPSGTVTECQRLDSIGMLQPHASVTGCTVFEVSAIARPVKLFIKSTPQVSWSIERGVIQEEPSGSAAAAPLPAGGTPNVSNSPSAGNTGTGNSGSSTSVACTGNTGSGNTGACPGGAGLALASGFAIVTTGLPGATTGVPYAQQLLASGGSTPYRWRRINGALPKGIHLVPTGLLVGRPRVGPGTYSFTVQVRDSTPRAHLEAVESLSLTVS